MFLEYSLPLRLAIIALIVLVMLWSTKRGFEYGLLLGLISGIFPMKQSFLIYTEGSLPQLTIDRVVWPVLLLVFLFKWSRGQTMRLALDSVEKNMLLLVGVVILSMYFHKSYVSDQWRGVNKVQLFPIVAGFLLPFVSYGFARRGILPGEHRNAFLRGVGLVTLYLAITGVGEAFHLNWLVYPKYILDPKEGIHFGYVRGPFISASINGLAMIMGAPILLWLFFSPHGKRRLVWGIGLGCIALALPRVFQRAVWLGALGAVGVTMLLWPKRAPLFIGGTLLVLATGALFMSNSLEKQIQAKMNASGNIDFRLELLDTSIKIIEESPLTGAGFARFRKAILEHSQGRPTALASHNTLMTLTVELGLLGIIPYLAIFALFLYESSVAFFHWPETRILIGGLWGITTAYFIMLVSVELREIFYVNGLFFSLWGMGLQAIREYAGAHQRPVAATRPVLSFA